MPLLSSLSTSLNPLHTADEDTEGTTDKDEDLAAVWDICVEAIVARMKVGTQGLAVLCGSTTRAQRTPGSRLSQGPHCLRQVHEGAPVDWVSMTHGAGQAADRARRQQRD